MLSWLRGRVRWLERRWIRDPDERSRHDTRVRGRLAGSSQDVDPVPQRGDPGDPEPDAERRSG